MDALLWIGFGGFALFFGGWVWFLIREIRADRKRWREIAGRLEAVGFTVAVAPRLGNPADGGELGRFMTDLIETSWQPESKVRCVRWFAQGGAAGRAVRMAEIELVRFREKNVFVESFLLTEAPAHWPDFCLLRKESARRMASEGGAPLPVRWELLTTSASVVLFVDREGRAGALANESLYADIENFPPDEQWFVHQGRLCCHWSQPLDGDRPVQMAERVEEFVGLMERHMLRVPRAL